jgi:hypothetical protein
MPRFETCCGCATARTGVVIIAILGILGSGMAILTGLISLGYVRQAQDARLLQDAPMDPHDLLVSNIVGNVINGIISGFLLYGVDNDKYLMIMPWLVFCMIQLAGATFGLVIGFIVLCVVLGWSGLGYGVILVVLVAPFLAFGYYLWTVVQSVYLDIKEYEQPRILA